MRLVATMANFTTHIAIGTVVTGALATLTLAADVVAPQNLVAVTLAGVLGSVLPDIDLKDSRPSRAMFAGLAIFFSFAVLFNAATEFSIAELWVLWLGTLLVVRYGLHAIFHRISVHRGIWHSILAAVFSSVATAIVFRYLLGKPEGVSWLAAAFMFVGYITHLTLDEIYSVDVMDTRIKSSFGTALKFFDRRHLGASLAMAGATAAAIMISPQTTTFVDGLSSHSMWTGLQQRMLPTDKWFGIVQGPHFASSKPDSESGITTSSIGEHSVGHAGEAKDTAAPIAQPQPAAEAAPLPAPAPASDVLPSSANP
ncbi:metal-dependent hydrolase [Hyphomicrobium sp.]|uniref:metal-dependent hydrolase n=1 Tax=Hyphomicrobium sp. TaxID=82 RepID=UPI0025BB894E|nr:metal-dependent hydrolase [Hyphomicrobium sp.]